MHYPMSLCHTLHTSASYTKKKKKKELLKHGHESKMTRFLQQGKNLSLEKQLFYSPPKTQISLKNYDSQRNVFVKNMVPRKFLVCQITTIPILNIIIIQLQRSVNPITTPRKIQHIRKLKDITLDKINKQGSGHFLFPLIYFL